MLSTVAGNRIGKTTVAGKPKTRVSRDAVKAGRYIREGRRRSASSQSADAKTSNPKYGHGEYVRIEIVAEADHATSIWMRVERCDDERAIVYGTIDDETSQGLGNALRSGARLGASYRQIRERRGAATVAPG